MNRNISYDHGFGGGSIFLYVNQLFNLSNSTLMANASPGYVEYANNDVNYSIGGGAGGAIKIYSSNIIGDSMSNISLSGGASDPNNLVGEGGGGVL